MVNKKYIKYIGPISIVLMVCFFCFILYKTWDFTPLYINIFILLSALITIIITIISKIKNIDSLYRFCILVVYIGTLFIVLYGILIYSGALNRIENYNGLKNLIQDYGKTAGWIYIIIQFLQVTIIPIPSNIVIIVGDELFGSGLAFLYSYIGQVLGSMFAFFLGKHYGVRLVKWIAGEEALEKYQRFVKGRDKTIIILMFLFPVFPDDIICMIAGLTSMSYLSFFIVQLVCRPISIGITILAKRGLFSIPFAGWGIIAWIVILGLGIYIFYICVKNGDKIESKMFSIMSKITKKDYHQITYGESEEEIETNIIAKSAQSTNNIESPSDIKEEGEVIIIKKE